MQTTTNLATLDQARGAKAKAMKIFAAKADVVGVGITQIDGGYGIKVNLREAPRPGASLPDDLDGVPVRIEVVGELRKR
ncbi:MAG TPA: hypothetical protein VHG32_10500 [Thermoanaerobaculia bacterium]|jgi:hypothetical protein|nr:hypothetical protein [Thermoanaerobaculia bacterium]